MENEWKLVGKVKNLYLYPLKSGKRIELDEAECTKRGLKEVGKNDNLFLLRDRSFVVYSQKSCEYKSIKHYPKLVLIEVKSIDVNKIQLNAPKMEMLILNIPDNKKKHTKVSIRQMEEHIPLIDCGEEAADWISKYLLQNNADLRIGYNDGTHERNPKGYQNLIDYNNRGFSAESMGLSSNMCAILLNSAASIRDVQQKTGISEITDSNFRPSILVDNENLEPFDEDNWKMVKIGNVVLKNVLECTRCIMTTVDMELGEMRKDREPLKTMEKYRLSKGPHKTPIMGIYLEVIETGKISLEDNVYVQQK